MAENKGWARYKLGEYRTLNESPSTMSVERCGSAGFRIAKLQLITNASRCPPRSATIDLSQLGISGIMLLATGSGPGRDTLTGVATDNGTAALVRLDLGCGNTKRPGFVGLDSFPGPTVDHVLDLTVDPFPFADDIRRRGVLGALPRAHRRAPTTSFRRDRAHVPRRCPHRVLDAVRVYQRSVPLRTSARHHRGDVDCTSGCRTVTSTRRCCEGLAARPLHLS